MTRNVSGGTAGDGSPWRVDVTYDDVTRVISNIHVDDPGGYTIHVEIFRRANGATVWSGTVSTTTDQPVNPALGLVYDTYNPDGSRNMNATYGYRAW